MLVYAESPPLPDAAAVLDALLVKLVRREPPSAHSIFEDTPITTPDVWQPLQMRRVRYFKKPATAASGSASGASAPPPVPTSAHPNSAAQNR